MRGGDISNDTPPRLYFAFETVTIPKVEQKKVLGLIPVLEKSWDWNLRTLDQVWRITQKYEVIGELVAFGDEFTQEMIDKSLQDLDELQTNPFNYGKHFDKVEDLINLLPYLTNLRGVVDIPSRVARYGSWGIELDNL